MPERGLRLAALLAAASVAAGRAAAADFTALLAASHTDAAGRLQVDVHFDCALAPPALSAAGLAAASTLKAGTLCVVEGWALPAALPQLAAVAGVTRLSAPSYVHRAPPRTLLPMLHGLAHAAVQKSGATPAIDQYGVSIQHAGAFVTQTGSNGAGVTVGVQSSGVYSLNLIEARGELPASVRVVQPASNPPPILADEGTALLEEVHAIAPGASLVYCGPSTFVDYTSCLTQLIDAGATILLDDTGFTSDGVMSEDNDQSSAVAQILTQNPAVMLFSAAGNNGGTYWEGPYAPVSVATTTLPALSCPASSGTPDAYVATFGGNANQTLTVSAGNGYASFPLLLAWADPPGQLTSRFDVFWFAAGSTTMLGCFSSANAVSDQAEQTLTLPSGSYTVVVASPDATTAGKFLKLWAGGDGLTGFAVATSGGLVSPQHMVPGVVTVGAVNGSDGIGDAIESFSSTGPLQVEFPAPALLQAPTLVAPDGINVDAAGTYFAAELFPDGNFYGTSAAVPNAAAVAALLRGAFPTLSVAEVTSALTRGATVLGAAAPDGVFGYGRVDALGALNTLPGPTISPLIDASSTGSASTTPQALNISGTGTLHFTVSSSNTALVPNAIVNTGTPGVSVSSGCGTSTLACTLTVTPVTGQAGMATLTVSVVDGANRSAPATMTFTATDPAPAPAPTGGGHGGGGGVQDWALLGIGALLAWSRSRAMGSRGLPTDRS
ncbi:MAG TPA: S8 family serine peptidase [Steroidobacteraceae bacterium]|nr:S8 family serine peptidase [Steroidobacteraceae bacterium]